MTMFYVVLPFNQYYTFSSNEFLVLDKANILSAMIAELSFSFQCCIFIFLNFYRWYVGMPPHDGSLHRYIHVLKKIMMDTCIYMITNHVIVTYEESRVLSFAECTLRRTASNTEIITRFSVMLSNKIWQHRFFFWGGGGFNPLISWRKVMTSCVHFPPRNIFLV